MADLARIALSTLVSLLVMGAIARATLSVRPGITGAERMIQPHRVVFLSLGLGCGALGVIALFSWVRHDAGLAAFLVGSGFSLGALLSASALSPALVVTWTDTTVTGPASHAMPPFGPRRVTLPFAEIEAVGRDAAGSFYVRGLDGKKIRWSEYHGGFAELNNQIAAARPDLFAEDPNAG